MMILGSLKPPVNQWVIPEKIPATTPMKEISAIHKQGVSDNSVLGHPKEVGEGITSNFHCGGNMERPNDTNNEISRIHCPVRSLNEFGGIKTCLVKSSWSWNKEWMSNELIYDVL